MYRTLSVFFILFVLLPAHSDCASPNGASPIENGIPPEQHVQALVDTQFARMLDLVPYSFLKEYDIWFGYPGKIKRLYCLEHLNSLDKLEQLPVKERREAMKKITEIPVPQFTGSYSQLAPLIGWDGFMTLSVVFHEVPPPWGFSVMEGDFDEALISGKLTEQEYENANYANYTYYWKNDDMGIDIRSDLGRLALARLNRVVILEDMLVLAPATDIMSGILDAMSGNVMAIIDAPSCQALADSMGDVQGAVLMTPDRVLKASPDSEIPSFDLPGATDWGTLHAYDMVGIGFLDDGEKRYWKISLYYSDMSAATADADELVSRLESYVFHTHLENMENVPLRSRYEVGAPTVDEQPAGATLAISCRYSSDTKGSGSLFTAMIQARDLLFLSPEPAAYTAD
jgi:hypothetical protein